MVPDSQESHSLAFFIMLSRLLFVHVVLALTLVSRTKRNLQNLSHFSENLSNSHLILGLNLLYETTVVLDAYLEFKA